MISLTTASAVRLHSLKTEINRKPNNDYKFIRLNKKLRSIK